MKSAENAEAPYTNTQITYRVIWWAILNFEYVHGTNHGLHCHKYVLEYQLNKATFIFIGITTAVDNSHLFDKCRFARFTSTYCGFKIFIINSFVFMKQFYQVKCISRTIIGQQNNIFICLIFRKSHAFVKSGIGRNGVVFNVTITLA